MSRQHYLLIASGSLIVVALVFHTWRWLAAGSESAIQLARVARSGDSEDVRQRAAVRLIGHASEAIVSLRELAANNNDPAVRATCIQGLGTLRDYESVELVLAAIDDPSPLVRMRAKRSLEQLWQRRLYFPFDGSPSERAQAAAQLRQQWSNLQRWNAIDALRKGIYLSYYYDRNTGELFEAPAELQAAETASGPYQGHPAGVHAHVFCCGEVGPPTTRFVGFVSLSGAELQRQGRLPAGARADMDALFVATPGTDVWHGVDSPEGVKITKGVVQRCPREKRPVSCYPED